MKKYIVIILVVAAAVGYYYYQSSSAKKAQAPTQGSEQQNSNQPEANTSEENMNNQPNNQDTTAAKTTPEKAVAVIDIKDFGTFKVTLDGKSAPKTVANFIKLSKEGFYNGLKFHRIVPGFVIQGGDPKGDGTGGPGYGIDPEIGLKHTKGAIAMARTSGPAETTPSSGSQFYVALEALPMLDGQYTVFGYVTSGMDVVAKIGKTPVDVNPMSGESSDPINDVIINKITIEE